MKEEASMPWGREGAVSSACGQPTDTALHALPLPPRRRARCECGRVSQSALVEGRALPVFLVYAGRNDGPVEG
jgi:hypothetical protein